MFGFVVLTKFHTYSRVQVSISDPVSFSKLINLGFAERLYDGILPVYGWIRHSYEVSDLFSSQGFDLGPSFFL